MTAIRLAISGCSVELVPGVWSASTSRAVRSCDSRPARVTARAAARSRVGTSTSRSSRCGTVPSCADVAAGWGVDEAGSGTGTPRIVARRTRPPVRVAGEREGSAVRVALVCGTYAPERDGVADYVRRLAAELRAGPRDRRRGRGSRPTRTGPLPGGAVAVTPTWSLRDLPSAARALDALGADLVHVQWAPSAYGWSGAVGLLPALLRTPVVTTLHEYGWWAWPGWVPSRLWPALERTGRLDRESVLLGPRSRALLVTNEGHAAVVRARLHREPALVPIGPNVPGPGPDAARRPGRAYGAGSGWPTGSRCWCSSASCTRSRASASSSTRPACCATPGVDVHVEVAGGFASLALPGEEARSFRAEVEQRVADRGVGDRVHLTGWVDGAEVSELLSAADAVVLPFTAGVTTKSGSLLAALEHGAPVLATVADVRDPALVDGLTVLDIAAWRDPASIAAAVPVCWTTRARDDGGAGRAGARGPARLADHRRPAPCRLRVRARGGRVSGFRRILVVELLGGFGDVLLVLPAVHALARSHPDAALTVLTFTPGDLLLAHDPLVTRVVPTERPHRRTAPRVVEAELDAAEAGARRTTWSSPRRPTTASATLRCARAARGDEPVAEPARRRADRPTVPAPARRRRVVDPAHADEPLLRDPHRARADRRPRPARELLCGRPHHRWFRRQKFAGRPGARVGDAGEGVAGGAVGRARGPRRRRVGRC